MSLEECLIEQRRDQSLNHKSKQIRYNQKDRYETSNNSFVSQNHFTNLKEIPTQNCKKKNMTQTRYIRSTCQNIQSLWNIKLLRNIVNIFYHWSIFFVIKNIRNNVVETFDFILHFWNKILKKNFCGILSTSKNKTTTKF